MLNELENKIRKAIPELMELGVGCEIETKYYGNFIIMNIDKEYNIYEGICSQNLHRHVNIRYITEIIGKPIQLNHVLEYWIDTTYRPVHLILNNWNLKSNLLKEQSNELITFINNL